MLNFPFSKSSIFNKRENSIFIKETVQIKAFITSYIFKVKCTLKGNPMLKIREKDQRKANSAFLTKKGILI